MVEMCPCVGVCVVWMCVLSVAYAITLIVSYILYGSIYVSCICFFWFSFGFGKVRLECFVDFREMES